MKKQLITAIAAATLGIFSASAFAQVELRMSWWGGNDRHQATLKALEEFHQQNPDITVKAEYTGWDGHLSRLTTQIAGNTEPDVMQTNWNWMPIFSKDGKGFYDMNTLKSQLHIENFPASALEMTTNKGKLNGIPISMSSRLFFYNETMWKKAGLDYPKTWDDLLAAGEVFKTKLGEQYYPLILEHQDAFALLRSYMIQKHNKDIINPETNLLNYTDEEWKEFFGFYKTLVEKHVIPSSKYYASFGKANLYEMKPWINGEFGGVYMWDSTISKYGDNLQQPMKLALAPYPMLSGATDAGLFYKPAQSFSIGRNTKHPEEAAKLVSFLMNDPAAVDTLKLTRGVPLSKAAKAELETKGILKPDNLSVAGIAQAQGLPMKIVASPYFDNPQLVVTFLDAIQSIDYGKGSVESIAEEFQASGNRLLKKAAK